MDVDGVPTEITLTRLVTDPWEETTASLIALDIVLSRISGFRATAGAQKNRLEHTNNNLSIAHMNLENARSRIMDADLALETMNLMKANILQESASAMLAQAGQTPDAVLQLLT